MRTYSVLTLAKAIVKAARLYPSSYVRVIRLWFGYDLMLFKLIKEKNLGDKGVDYNCEVPDSSSRGIWLGPSKR